MTHDNKHWFTPVLILLVAFILPNGALAELELHISKSAGDGIPILIAPISGGANAIIDADLKRSGRFTSVYLKKGAIMPAFGVRLSPTILRAIKAEYIVRGRLTKAGLDVELTDTSTGARVASYRIANVPNRRRMAHKAADKIFERITRLKGAFDTRLAYVTVTGRRPNKHYRLYIADSDGYNPHVILNSDQPIMSPSWSPNGKQLAYVSFESGKSAIYIQNIFSGKKRMISGRTGINGAPTWSRNGSQIAMSLSVDGNSEIYILSVYNGVLKRLTNDRSIDTEPAWSGDGRSIVFTSNRGGAAQLYKVPTYGGKAKRMTFVGNYNSAADIVGNKIALVRRHGGHFRIAIMQMGGAGADIISTGRYDESPSLAPNGTMIAYATQRKGRGKLVVVSDNGKSKQELHAPEGEVREPAWSPYIR
ncbi:MAG: Tol-Pal system beta propeller repeat protein TolB [Cocleimonas sp.]|nr:Tol-Pal system beta propeller repeat protein TolB [Cocleimonas sp.]